MTSMEIPENLTEVMMGGSDEKENSPERDRAKRKLSLNSNSSGMHGNPIELPTSGLNNTDVLAYSDTNYSDIE